MSVFGSIWLGVKTIFGANPEKGADMVSGIGNFIDESFHTDEEKSKAKFKWFELKLKWMNATQGQNLARRYCAIFFGLNYMAAFQICLGSLFYEFVTDSEMTGQAFTGLVIDLVIAFQLGWIVLTIIGFYFVKEFNAPVKK